MNNKKRIPICLATIMALPVLTGCNNQTDLTVQNSTQDDTDATTSIGDVQENYLAVDQNKCIGCGHCVKFDSEHFVMNDAQKSTVISQNNLDSSSLATAISRCPVNAITL